MHLRCRIAPRREESFTWGRLLWRLGRRPRARSPSAPSARSGPSWRSPTPATCAAASATPTRRATPCSARPELSDEQWREVVRQSLDLGIVEAVVTGGEPFLRTGADPGGDRGRWPRPASGVTLNTNGWFVDEEVAARLGALRGRAPPTSRSTAPARACTTARAGSRAAGAAPSRGSTACSAPGSASARCTS